MDNRQLRQDRLVHQDRRETWARKANLVPKVNKDHKDLQVELYMIHSFLECCGGIFCRRGRP